MMRTVAQIHIEENPYTATAAKEYGGTVGGKPRPVRRQKQIGCELIAQRFADLT